MILTDSSVWVDHFRKPDPVLVRLLEEGVILVLDAIVGELAMGNFSQRAATLTEFARMPRAVVASDIEVLRLIETNRLYGTGLSYIDAQILAATLLTADALLWARDVRLRRAAEQFKVAAPHA